MVVTSTLSNFFSNLTNHSRARKTILKQRFTQPILRIIHLLVQEGYLYGYHILEDQYVLVLLKYVNQKPSITKIQQLSKPGRRVFINNQWLYKNKTTDLYLISTNKGLMTQNKACQLNLGGELICKIS